MKYSEMIIKWEQKIMKAEKQFNHSKSPAWELKIERLRKQLNHLKKKKAIFINSENKFSKKEVIQPVNKSDTASTINAFSDIDISEFLSQNILTMKLKKPTNIQKQSIKPFLEGNDLVISSKTGTGKTLAFLIPLVELLSRSVNVCPLSSLIMLPTRELAIQVYAELKKLLIGSDLKGGLVKGGGSRTAEFEYEIQGSHILVATPGRLVDHLQNGTDNGQTVSLKNVRALVIDEADIMLEQGHLKKLTIILETLPKNRQSILASATLNKASRHLAASALKKNHLVICEEVESTNSTDLQLSSDELMQVDTFNTVKELVQGYVLCPSDRRFCCLYTFLKIHRDKKCMVFMSARDEVTFYKRALEKFGLSVLSLCGSMSQSQRSQTLTAFTESESATLLCTSLAARGLHIPRVECVIQYDPPQDIKEYIHRVGRTARAGKMGHALLILKPHESAFLQELKMNGVNISQYEFDFAKILDIRNEVKRIVQEDSQLRSLATTAYASVLRGYASADHSEYFDWNRLNKSDLAKCFGLDKPPNVHIQVKNSLEERMTWSKVVGTSNKSKKKSKTGKS